MPDYRRNRVSGGTYFFTVSLQDRSANTLVTEIETLREAVRDARARKRFHIDAWVMLPNHMHSIWTLPEGDTDYSSRWRAIKKAFSKSMPLGEFRSASNRRRHERGIWQARFWEHTIRDDRDYAAHMDYTHFNPVKHGFVSAAADWPYSTFHRCVRAGLYSSSWSTSPENIGPCGEASGSGG